MLAHAGAQSSRSGSGGTASCPWARGLGPAGAAGGRGVCSDQTRQSPLDPGLLDLPRGGLDASRLPNVDARTSSLVFKRRSVTLQRRGVGLFQARTARSMICAQCSACSACSEVKGVLRERGWSRGTSDEQLGLNSRSLGQGTQSRAEMCTRTVWLHGLSSGSAHVERESVYVYEYKMGEARWMEMLR